MYLVIWYIYISYLSYQMTNNQDLSAWKNALSGSIAGVCSRFVVAPLDVIKIRLQLDTAPIYSETTKYPSITNLTKKLLFQEGFRSFWKVIFVNNRGI
jgi:solute carrier family 25 thiamine pyrophosphate transporter 19